MHLTLKLLHALILENNLGFILQGKLQPGVEEGIQTSKKYKYVGPASC